MSISAADKEREGQRWAMFLKMKKGIFSDVINAAFEREGQINNDTKVADVYGRRNSGVTDAGGK